MNKKKVIIKKGIVGNTKKICQNTLLEMINEIFH